MRRRDDIDRRSQGAGIGVFATLSIEVIWSTNDCTLDKDEMVFTWNDGVTYIPLIEFVPEY
jgi:hypothetical protein